ADKDSKLRETAQTQLGALELEPQTVVSLLEQVLESGRTTEQQKALASLGNTKSPAAEELLGEWMDRLSEGKVIPELQLDVLMAVEESQFENLKEKKANYEARKKEEGLLSEFAMTLQGGNSDRGRRIFYRNNSAQCIRCHRIQGNGGEVGPELTHIASVISREEILTSLIDPSARIAPGYGTVEVILKDDSKVIGILEKVSNTSITLNPPSGEPLEIKLKDIKERKNYPSGMFSMKDVISKEEIRDLVAYLVELK
ncbi:MAG: c-type cytochrome, partial [Bacteroidia bacterium]